MAHEFGVPFLGRAPIDPNFVLAIENNQGNHIDRQQVNEDGLRRRTIVDEYQQLALYHIFKDIAAKLIDADSNY